jgi:hypothetical protein
MSAARRDLVFLLPLSLCTGIAVNACSLVAGLKDNVEIGLDGGTDGAGGTIDAGETGVGVGGSCDVDGGVAPIDLIPGFMDSRDVPCSNGKKLVDCTCVPPEFHGQDAESLGIVPTFLPAAPNEPNASIEMHTGLKWWTIPSPDKDFKTAQEICAGLGGGYRLPSRLEYWTIIEHNQIGDTLLDENVFKGIEPGIVWTSTPYTYTGHPQTDHWVIDICSKCSTSSRSNGLHESNGGTVLCVTGNEVTSGPFTDQADGTLLDETTHLVWMAKIETGNGLGWRDALEYCESNTFGQHTDWRLPTIKELQTIMDATKTNDSSLYGGFMIESSQPVLWSSTPNWTGAKFYQLSSGGGSTSSGNETYMSATCVRRQD